MQKQQVQQVQVQHIKTYNDKGGCYDVVFSICCGLFITTILVLIIVFVK